MPVVPEPKRVARVVGEDVLHLNRQTKLVMVEMMTVTVRSMKVVLVGLANFDDVELTLVHVAEVSRFVSAASGIPIVEMRSLQKQRPVTTKTMTAMV